MKTYDAIIIGFGKGGKTLAVELAKREWTVAVVERSEKMYGGTCINTGCIPTKTLIHQAKAAAMRFELPFDRKKEFYRRAVAVKEEVVSSLRDRNYHNLADRPGIAVYTGVGSFVSPDEVSVEGAEGRQVLKAKYIFIDTGAETVLPPIDGLSASRFLHTSASIMELKELPRRLAKAAAMRFELPFDRKKEFYRRAVAVKEEVVSSLRDRNYHNLADRPGIAVYTGVGSFVSPDEVSVEGAEGRQVLKAKYIFIDTGAETVLPPIDGLSASRFLHTSASIMELKELPRRLAIVGGGYIGLEFASMYASFGSEVTVFEGGPVLMPREDRDVADSVRETLEKKGIVFRTGADVLSVRDSGGAAKVSWRQAGEGRVGELEADAVLIAAGRRPATEGLNLEAAGVKVDSRGAVIVDDRLRTSNPNIRAIGDVKGGLQFTYISLDDYRIIRDDLFGAAVRKTGDRNPVAYSVFIDPPLSHIGITEETARRNNLDVRVNRIAVASIPRMRTIGETDGLLKAVIDARTNRILGCTLFCPESSEVINTVAVAMKSGRTAAFLRDFVFTHPSVSEALNDLFV